MICGTIFRGGFHRDTKGRFRKSIFFCFPYFFFFFHINIIFMFGKRIPSLQVVTLESFLRTGKVLVYTNPHHSGQNSLICFYCT